MFILLKKQIEQIITLEEIKKIRWWLYVTGAMAASLEGKCKNEWIK